MDLRRSLVRQGKSPTTTSRRGGRGGRARPGRAGNDERPVRSMSGRGVRRRPRSGPSGEGGTVGSAGAQQLRGEARGAPGRAAAASSCASIRFGRERSSTSYIDQARLTPRALRAVGRARGRPPGSRATCRCSARRPGSWRTRSRRPASRQNGRSPLPRQQPRGAASSAEVSPTSRPMSLLATRPESEPIARTEHRASSAKAVVIG